MKSSIISIHLLLFGVFFVPASQAEMIRWTGAEDSSADLGHILELINFRTGYNLSPATFLKIEDTDLANNHFTYYAQTAGGVALYARSIRVWSEIGSNKLIQMEAQVDSDKIQNHLLAQFQKLGLSATTLRSNSFSSKTLELVRTVVKKHSDDKVMASVHWNDFWQEGRLIRVVKVKGRRGVHEIRISLQHNVVLSTTYEEFPQSEFSIPVQVYPVYEEIENPDGPPKILSRITDAELRYLHTSLPVVEKDSFDELLNQKYLEFFYHPILGLTPEGRNLGFWSMAYIKSLADQIRGSLPQSDNSFESGGVRLQGRYATVSLHPAVLKAFPNLNFKPALSGYLKPDWVVAGTIDSNEVYEMKPSLGLMGRPITSPQDAWDRPAQRLANHDPATYINDGFDEIQVYYAVTSLFESLHGMGFTDPGISTRPFHAFLYDPDIAYRNNAYYTDDTINFTTYSEHAANYARDNPTIWHELGHGIMDRLMGDLITLADTGGLSEGMADFVAALVLEDRMGGKPFEGSDQFRILNKTGFFLTNEVHDDGEAYGGTMKDLLENAIQRDGRIGLTKVADLVLETMRLCRNHPALTAQEWFSHMLFADELGRPDVRTKGEMRDLILAALSGRNFNLVQGRPARFNLLNGEDEIEAGTPGSRQMPIRLKLKSDEVASFPLSVQLLNGSNYAFQFPVTVQIDFRTGPLQGAVRWVNEDNTPLTFQITEEGEVLPLNVQVKGQCDEINRDDGSCVDYAYVQIFNHGETKKPQAKKRFYVRVKAEPSQGEIAGAPAGN